MELTSPTLNRRYLRAPASSSRSAARLPRELPLFPVTAATGARVSPGPRLAPDAARLTRALAQARRTRRPLLGLCIPAGWPPASGNSGAVYREAARSADIVEVAVPVPPERARLDGPVMTAAYEESLAAGYRHDHLPGILQTINTTGSLAVVMAYWSVICEAGPEETARYLAAAGAAAVVIPDLPAREARTWTGPAAGAGLHTILMADHPARATGAVYLPAAPGLTGTGARPYPGLAGAIARARSETGLPVIAGIGIRTPGRAAGAARAGADVVLAGSALLEAIRADHGAPAAAVSTMSARFRTALADPGSPVRPCSPPGAS